MELFYTTEFYCFISFLTGIILAAVYKVKHGNVKSQYIIDLECDVSNLEIEVVSGSNKICKLSKKNKKLKDKLINEKIKNDINTLTILNQQQCIKRLAFSPTDDEEPTNEEEIKGVVKTSPDGDKLITFSLEDK